MSEQSYVATGRLTLLATCNTLLKRQPVQSSDLAEKELFFVVANHELAINWYKRCGSHVKVSLDEPVKGFHDWYSYFEHVEALEDGRVKDTFDETLLITKHQAEAIFGNTIRDNELKDLNHCLSKFQIDTDARVRHFMAQIAHESGGLKWMQELASGAAYEGRRDLGNTRPGDGRRYKGAGCIQLTGRANYQAFADHIQDPRVMEGCGYVSMLYPFTSAGFWWHNNKMNALVDGGASCRRISARVNGLDPANGLADREMYYKRACAAIR